MAKEIKITGKYRVFTNISELGKDYRKLLNAARKAATQAYAPYSGFHVGAAVLLHNGTVVIGNNQENVAFPSGLCAERVALFAAASANPLQKIKAIAITECSEEFKIRAPLAPCGACRQVMAEYEMRQNSNIQLILQGDTGEIWVVENIQTIMPLMFFTEKLKRR